MSSSTACLEVRYHPGRFEIMARRTAGSLMDVGPNTLPVSPLNSSWLCTGLPDNNKDNSLE